MLVSEILQRSVVPVTPGTLLVDIIPEDYPENLQYIPVVEDHNFKGFLSLADFDSDQEENETVQQCDLEQVELPASSGQHIFEVLHLFQKAALPVLPVLDENSQYEGVINVEEVLSTFANSYAFQKDGGILVLSIAANNYSLSEISRLVESNQAQILSLLVESDPFTHDKLLVHLKLNQIDLSRTIATLERFDYQIIEVHHKSEGTSIDQERLDMLMKYLGI